MITRCALFGLCVRDSKVVEDSPPGLEFAVEWSVLSILRSDH